MKWSNHCEVILENSIGVQSFVNKFKEAKNHGPTSLDRKGLAQLLSINIDCLKSFYESIAGREMGIWRANYLDITLFFKETWLKLWENIADALGMLVLLVILIVGTYGLNYILNPHPRINKIAHKIECNRYGVCDK